MAEKAGYPIPEAVKFEPQLDVELLEYLDAFWLLNTSRQNAFSVGYIPLTEIESFCRMFPVQDVPMFVLIIRHMDRLYVDFQNEKLKSDSRKK